MKIGITADIHLKSKNETPERYGALEKIIDYLKSENIKDLIIAGDLFDKERHNYNDFDTFCKQHSDINFYIIPGNHDTGLVSSSLVSNNIHIINETQIINFDSVNFLFVPYDLKKSLDESINDFMSISENTEKKEKLVIVGHGDYISTQRIVNEYEPGFYMPLSLNTIYKYNPLQVFLGHIHKPSQLGKVSYAGSPYPLDVNETGKRRFLIYDTQINNIDSIEIDNDVIYFIENILMLPADDEITYINEKIEKMIANWHLNNNDDLIKVKLRLNVFGYTKDINNLVNHIINFIKNKGISFYDVNEVNYQDLKLLSNEENERKEIFDIVRGKIESLPLPEKEFADKDSIIEKAMELIF
jgi:DNA repair exonuclease SbcCD nuclease subunit